MFCPLTKAASGSRGSSYAFVAETVESIQVGGW